MNGGASNWVAALAVSAAVAVALTPVARRLAASAGFVHRRSGRTPYLGGVVVGLAVVCGFVAGRGAGVGAAVIALGAALVVVGLLNDDRRVPAPILLGLIALCALWCLLAGVRLVGTGVHGLDVVLTFVVLVGVTEAHGQLDAVDGLAPAVAIGGGAGVFVLSLMDGRVLPEVLSACLVGACLGFMVFNAKPALIRLGSAGSLFLGFTLASAAIIIGSYQGQPASLVVPFLVVCLPLADGVAVLVGRHRRRLPLFEDRRDHLSHRLAARGLRTTGSVVALFAVEGAQAGLAVAVGRQKIPSWAGLAAGLAVLAVTLVAARTGRVYSAKPVGVSWKVWLAAVVLGCAVVGLAVPTVLAGLRARQPLLAGQHATQRALAAARAGHLSVASADFATAASDFKTAHGLLDGPLVSAGLAYPVISSNLQATRAIVDIGIELVGRGRQVALAGDRFRYQVRGGYVPVTQLAATAPSLRAALSSIDDAHTRLEAIDHRYLVAEVSHAVAELTQQLAPARRDVAQAEAIATNVPPLLGLDGPRIYFVAMQDDGEARATGGIIAFYGVLRADDGRMQLLRVASYAGLNSATPRPLHAPAQYVARYGVFDPAENWQNVNMSPDFPTVGSVIAGLYPESGGVPVNGVIGIDAYGLAALLRLSGPVRVMGWPKAISAHNVAEVTQFEAYRVYAGDETGRDTFMRNLVRAAFEAITHVTLTDPAALVDTLEPAFLQRHMLFYDTNPEAEHYLASIGTTGAEPPVESDSVGITTQNASANKLDWYLRRTLTYRVRIDPTGGSAPRTAQVTGTIGVTLDNPSPTRGLSRVFLGPFQSGFTAGEYESYLTVYTPLGYTRATLAGVPTGLQALPELGRQAYSTFIDLPAGATTQLDLSVSGTVELERDGWYVLDLPEQPAVNPAHVVVDLSVGAGWRIAEAHGAIVVGNSASAAFLAVADRSVAVQLVKDGGAG